MGLETREHLEGRCGAGGPWQWRVSCLHGSVAVGRLHPVSPQKLRLLPVRQDDCAAQALVETLDFDRCTVANVNRRARQDPGGRSRPRLGIPYQRHITWSNHLDSEFLELPPAAELERLQLWILKAPPTEALEGPARGFQMGRRSRQARPEHVCQSVEEDRRLGAAQSFGLDGVYHCPLGPIVRSLCRFSCVEQSGQDSQCRPDSQTSSSHVRYCIMKIFMDEQSLA